MFAPLKRVAAISMAVGSVILVGCDDSHSGDKAVQKNLKKANLALAAADFNSADAAANAETMSSVIGTYKTAADDNGASPVWKAVASNQLGTLQLKKADGESSDLRSTETQIRQTLSQLRSLSQQIAFNNSIITGYKSQDASATIASINSLVKQMQGDAQNTTWGVSKDQPGTLATLASLNQSASNLEGQIAERKTRIDALNAERTAALKESDEKITESNKLKGDDALKLYKQGVEAKQHAEDTSMKIDLENEQLGRLEADLKLNKTQTENLNKGIEELQNQSKIVADGDSKMKEQIDKQKQIAKLIAIGDKSGSTYHIDSKSKELVALLEKAKAQRTALHDSLDEAKKYFEAAAAAGSSARTELGNPGKGDNADAMKKLALSVNAGQYNLRLGVALRRLASLSSNQAQLTNEIASTRLMLVNALTSAEETVNLWPATETKEIEELITSAETDLKASSDALENAGNGDTTDTTRNAAKIAKLITMYRQLQLADLQKSAGMTVKSDDIAKLTSDADGLKKDILESHLVLPKLPGELGEMPAVTAPTVTQDTTAPEATADTPEIAAIRTSIQTAVTSATTGQLQPLIDLVIVPEYLKAGIQPVIDFVPTFDKFHQSVVAKFGEDGWKALTASENPDQAQQDPAAMLANLQKEIAKLKFKTISETEIELIPETPMPEGKKIVFKKVDDAWKIDLSTVISEQEAPMLGIVSMIVSGVKTKVEQLTTDIDAGKYNTIDELKAAAKEQMKEGIMPGMPGGTTPPVAPAGVETPAPTPAAATPPAN